MNVFTLCCKERDTEIKNKVQVRYRVFHILPQIYTANHATDFIQMYAITA